MRREILPFICLLFFTLFVRAQNPVPDFLKMKTPWADSIIKTFTLEEKIGQLIMVTAYANQGESDEKVIISQIKDGKIGGVLFLKTDANRLALLSNKYQEASQTPLFIGIDGENGLSFRLEDSPSYPYNIALGAIQDDSLIYRMGREIGQQCKALGINLNFSPVVDINSNPENPVINYRSFGSIADNVARKGVNLAKGMQDEKIVVSAKHFPGHGDTSSDSHLALPSLKYDYARLDSVEFMPFKAAINTGINGIMSAHIAMPLIDDSECPSTLSKVIIGGCLRDSLNFAGLIFSDAMNMKGVLQNDTEAQAIVKALIAGVDVVEFVTQPTKAIDEIKKAIKNGEITVEQIEQKCLNVLRAKEWAGINRTQPVCLEKVDEAMSKVDYQLTKRKLIEASITVVKNEQNILPVQHFDSTRIAAVAIGAENETVFQKRLASYTNVDMFNLPKNGTDEQLDRLLSQLKNYDLVITSVSNINNSPSKRYGISNIQQKAVKAVSQSQNSIMVFFCNPFALTQFSGFEMNKSIVLAYSNGEEENDLAAQAIMGAINVSGKSPIQIENVCDAGFGIDIKNIGRLGFAMPEEEGFNGQLLNSKLDSFCMAAIADTIFPGCQILIAQNGKIILQKSYGHHTYKATDIVTNSDLYDWASITKITGPLLPLMKLYDEKKIDLDTPICQYLSSFKHTDKDKITLRQTLSHQAGLKSGLLFHLSLLDKNSRLKNEFVSTKPSAQKSVQLSENLYIDKKYKQIMMQQILDSKLSKTPKYLYSDLAAMTYPDLISNVTNKDYENYLYQTFYRPMGITSATYNPARKFPLEKIVPTEIDYTFRKEEVHGYVHDESCAMMGGVSGNAGLFGSSLDLAKVMQLYLQKGYYGGIQYVKSSTVDLFNQRQYSQNRRGLGFDKPQINNCTLPEDEAYPAKLSSDSSFGHSGFTGSFVWADPEKQLLYIFLSNRTYPTRENNKLSKSNLRTKIQEEIYKLENSYKASIH